MKFKIEIGIRNLKTSLAVFISIILSYLLNLHSPFLAAISALLVMEASVVDTVRSGKNRILATILGATIACLFCFISPGEVVLAALGIVIIISLCGMINWNSFIPAAGIIFLSIMFGVEKGTNPIEYSFIAVLSTFLGIAVAFCVNFLIAPPNHIESVLHSYQILRDNTSNLIKRRLCYGENIDTFGFYDKIQNLSDDLNTLIEEIRLSKDRPLHGDNIKEMILLYKHIYFHLTVLNDFKEDICLSEENLSKLKSIYGKVPEKITCSSKEENLVFNYHVGKILDTYIYVQSLTITRES